MSQIVIHATIAGRKDTRTVTLLLDGDVKLSGLHVACMHAINDQHSHEAGRPIVSLKYDVRANASTPQPATGKVFGSQLTELLADPRVGCTSLNLSRLPDGSFRDTIFHHTGKGD